MRKITIDMILDYSCQFTGEFGIAKHEYINWCNAEDELTLAQWLRFRLKQHEINLEVIHGRARDTYRFTVPEDKFTFLQLKYAS